MKTILYFLLSILIISCATPKKADSYNFENDPNLSEQQKQSMRDYEKREKLTLQELEDEYSKIKVDRFHHIEEVIEKALKEKRYDKGESYAQEYLKLAQKNKNDWNYGNAIYHSNMYLSAVAFNKGHREDTITYLLRASKSPSSAQLSSFGPFQPKHRAYLQKLAKAGEKKILIEYANNCKNLFNHEIKSTVTEDEKRLVEKVKNQNLNDVDQFIKQIESDKIPDFKYW